MKKTLDNFDWGWMDEPTDVYRILGDGSHKHMGQFHKDAIIQEIYVDNCYERFFEVKQGDIVLDVGASVGPFTYSILDKGPKHVFCFEPSFQEFKTLVKNTIGNPVTHIHKGVSNKNSIVENDELFGGENEMEGITFKKFVDLFGVDKIDFIKTDCEGGEYHIFNDENMEYIKKNVKKIVGEWHLQLEGHNYVEEFRHFRDTYLKEFPNHQVYSLDNVDIKWDLWNENFLQYYRQVLIYIDNQD